MGGVTSLEKGLRGCAAVKTPFSRSLSYIIYMYSTIPLFNIFQFQKTSYSYQQSHNISQFSIQNA